MLRVNTAFLTVLNFGSARAKGNIHIEKWGTKITPSFFKTVLKKGFLKKGGTVELIKIKAIGK